MRESRCWLTWKLWLARKWGRSLHLPLGNFGTDGRHLWKLPDDEEEGWPPRTASAGNPDPGPQDHSDDGYSAAAKQHPVGDRLHRAGHSRHEGQRQRDDGLRELRESSPGERQDQPVPQSSRPLQELQLFQRDADLEPLVELGQDLQDRVTNFAKSGRWVTTGQCWVDHKLALHLHVTVWRAPLGSGEVDTDQWCVDFEAGRPGDEIPETSNRPIRLDLGVQMRTEVHGDWHHHPVLVAVREIAKPSYRPRSHAATVWLIPPDECPLLWVNARKLPIDPIPPTGETLGDREIHVLRTPRARIGPGLY